MKKKSKVIIEKGIENFGKLLTFRCKTEVINVKNINPKRRNSELILKKLEQAIPAIKNKVNQVGK